MKTSGLSLILFFSLAVSAFGQDWAKKMFSETSHDFGTVARGAKVEYKFTIENLYEEDAHISAVFSSCECTSPTIEKRSLKTWEKAELKATVNTRDFFGQKDATITVKFDAPFPAEVQVHVQTRIRSDVVVQPEEFQFGTVKLGSTAERQVRINYAGRSDWKITKVECANSSIETKLVETSRVGNKVSYDLVAKLKDDAPAGYIKDTLFLVTNDPVTQSARVPIAVEGIVVSPLTARPNPLLLGVLKKGQTAVKPLVIQSSATPAASFKITGFKCNDPRFDVKLPAESDTKHVLPVTFKGSDKEGRVSAKITLETDLPKSQPIEITANVQITP
jgi:hypothetical protein